MIIVMQRAMIGAAGAALLLVTPALAERVSHESDITSLRLGQHIYVDDGTCPAGQIKEITGSKLTPQGVAFTRKCLDRKNMRQ